MTGATADYAIRLLGVADAPAYRALRLRMLHQYPDAFTSSYEEDVQHPLKWTEARLACSPWTPDNFVLGALVGLDSLMGAVGITRESRPKQAHKAALFGMFVAPEYASRGIGKALLDACIARCRYAEGLLQINLSVTSNNQRACSLYRTAGFCVYGVEPRAIVINGSGISKTHMVLVLDG